MSLENGNDGSFWISYSDLAVGVLMVFVLITTVLLLDTVEQSAAAAQAHEEAVGFRAKAEVAEQKAVKAKAEAVTAKAQAVLAKKDADLARNKAQNFEKQLRTKTQEIEAIVGIRQSLIAELSREFAKQGHQIKVDEKTGALQLPSDIIFQQGESKLSDGGRIWLNRFVPRYLGILLSPKFSSYVRRIEVEGHASSEGDEVPNLELSQARALSVAKFILSQSKEHSTANDQARLKQILTASGRGEYELVYGSNGEDREASRRVVFKFRLTEEEALKDIQRMLGGDR